MRSQAHDSILRVLSVDRDRDDNATLKLFDPLIADAKTSERRQFLVSAFKRLSNRPYVIRLLGRIKQTAEDQRNAVEPKFQAAEEALSAMGGQVRWAKPMMRQPRPIMRPRKRFIMSCPAEDRGKIQIAAVDKALKRSGRRLFPPGRPLLPRTGMMTTLP